MLVIFNVIFVAFIAGIIIFIKSYRQRKKEHVQELENVSLKHKKELLTTQLEIQQQTMKHLGREIHDNVGQKLTLSSLYLQQLPIENQSKEVVESLNNINSIINESLEDLRLLSKSLTDDSINDLTIVKLLENECDKVRSLKKFKIDFKNTLKSNVSYEMKSVLLRVTQEFLQNSIKHSKCKNIFISLSKTNKHLDLQLQDDGKGFDLKNLKTSGIGLKNIEKRIKLLDGTFNPKSGKNGTTFNIKIPI